MRPKEEKWTKVAYIAGPYRADNEFLTKRNIRAAEDVGVLLWYYGFIAIVPHMNTAFLRGAYGLTDEVWQKGYLEIVKRIDLLVVLPGWKFSPGTIEEVELANKLQIPVYFWAENFDRYNLEYYYESEE